MDQDIITIPGHHNNPFFMTSNPNMPSGVSSDSDIQILEGSSDESSDSSLTTKNAISKVLQSLNNNISSDALSDSDVSEGSDSVKSCDGDCGDGDAAEKNDFKNLATKFKKLFNPQFFQNQLQRKDKEADIIIPLDDEKEEQAFPINLNADGQMQCSVCPMTFSSKIRYQMHQTRHFALDHFICPKCSRGFTEFSLCQAHELQEHCKDVENGVSGASYANSMEGIVGVEKRNVGVPSSSLYPYRGPIVEGSYAPYEIELKYLTGERKSYSSIAAKYTLDYQRENRVQYDDEEEVPITEPPPKPTTSKTQVKRRRSKNTEVKEKKRRRLTYSEDESSDDDERREPNYVPNYPSRGRPPRNGGKPSTVVEKFKFYFCAICDFQAGFHEHSIQQHRRLHHPEIPLNDVVNYIYKKSVKPPKVGGLTKTLRSHSRQTRATTSAQEKSIKIPKIHTRVWEKTKKKVKQSEFIRALGLVAKGDVVIGPRKGSSATVSSLYRLRKARKRELSPSPHLHVVLHKLKNTKNKIFRVCPFPSCDFYDISKSEVRRHRGEVHAGEKLNKDRSQSRAKKHTRKSSTSKNAGPSSQYKCSRCQYNAPSPQLLNIHIQREHSDAAKLIKSLAAKFVGN